MSHIIDGVVFGFDLNANIKWSALNGYQRRVSNYQICLLTERINRGYLIGFLV